MSRSISRELLTFALIGVGGLFVDMAALAVALHLLGLDPYGGRVFSYLMAATFTWYLNRRFTFVGVSRRAALRQWAKFLAANAVGAVVNYGVYVLVLRVGPGILTALGLADMLGGLLPYAGVAAGSVSGLVFNFAMSKFVVFRRPA
ncbi:MULTISPECIES: GtrA family protein [unclassified Azospirillum]|uniref:GtrA family protein n=1 Tax=unclassified Azospirillum TaxID=2630922 RepID=UPI000B6B472F|nr:MULTISPECIES: GtrA family protein [unclassified Azospirillum]SNR97576.1 Putative flippase GtrA (transmembrane translocase of bactoprenol-linked glucose) [Azospirillum sp. RU38E]SNS14725.1 Putative flippase GtrA (transmembrane translocase of bactoprenol-linked glucose) [Azospirillum sp. RU37A]